jgi:hypothetical protein
MSHQFLQKDFAQCNLRGSFIPPHVTEVVVLAEVLGGITQGRCEVKLADWLQRLS